MNLEKALKLLNLSRNFTREDLNKAYKNILAKYDSNLYKNTIKELNDAQTFLIEYLKNSKFINEFNDSDELGRYRNPIILEIEDIKRDVGKTNTLEDNLLTGLHFAFQFKTSDYLTEIKKCNSVTNILLCKMEFDNEFENFKYKCKKAFYKIYNLPSDYMSDKINYKASIIEFYETLENIRTSYLDKMKYIKRKQEILKKVCFSTLDEKIILLYKRYEDSINTSTTYSKKLEDSLKELLMKYEIGKTTLIYLEVIDKFDKYLDNDELMKKINYIFNLYESGLIGIEEILLLDSINFKTAELDDYKLNLILGKVRKLEKKYTNKEY